MSSSIASLRQSRLTSLSLLPVSSLDSAFPIPFVPRTSYSGYLFSPVPTTLSVPSPFPNSYSVYLSSKCLVRTGRIPFDYITPCVPGFKQSLYVLVGLVDVLAHLSDVGIQDG